MVVGARTKATARRLWASLPGVYRQCAVCYTDFWQAYAAILPSKRHRASGKESGQTSHSERFNNTLRQRCSRLVRKLLMRVLIGKNPNVCVPRSHRARRCDSLHS
jgi:insertion element IS1 protein InsB